MSYFVQQFGAGDCNCDIQGYIAVARTCMWEQHFASHHLIFEQYFPAVQRCLLYHQSGCRMVNSAVVYRYGLVYRQIVSEKYLNSLQVQNLDSWLNSGLLDSHRALMIVWFDHHPHTRKTWSNVSYELAVVLGI